MARLDLSAADLAAGAPETADSEALFRLGIMYSTGVSVETDRIAAHKWFNVAAARGHEGAAQYRRELAEEMAGEDVREALRQAREYLTMH